MREIALLEGKCADCEHVFGHPSLGDFAYGEVVLSTVDGKHYATADAFGKFAQRVDALVKSDASRSLWPLLASLADPIGGQPLTHSICCPHCASDKLEYWGGRQVGTLAVPEASFAASSAFSADVLAAHIGVAVHGHEV